MSNNQSFHKIEKEIKSMASLLIFQESLIERIITEMETNIDASANKENQVVYN